MDILLFLLLFIVYMVWDYKFSHASKLLNILKEEEPAIYAKLYGKSFLPPRSLLHGVAGQGLYLEMKNKQLKDEIVEMDNKSAKYVALPMYIFIGFLLLSLMLQAIYGN